MFSKFLYILLLLVISACDNEISEFHNVEKDWQKIEEEVQRNTLRIYKNEIEKYNKLLSCSFSEEVDFIKIFGGYFPIVGSFVINTDEFLTDENGVGLPGVFLTRKIRYDNPKDLIQLHENGYISYGKYSDYIKHSQYQELVWEIAERITKKDFIDKKDIKDFEQGGLFVTEKTIYLDNGDKHVKVIIHDKNMFLTIEDRNIDLRKLMLDSFMHIKNTDGCLKKIITHEEIQ